MVGPELTEDIDYAQNEVNLEPFYERFLRERIEDAELDRKLLILVYSNKNQGAVWRTDVDAERCTNQRREHAHARIQVDVPNRQLRSQIARGSVH